VCRYITDGYRRRSMTVKMPAPEAQVLSRRTEIVRALRRIVPGEGVIATEHEMRPYESDGLTAYRQLPMVVVLPQTTRQVARGLKYCYEHGIKVVPRGAGTSLSGGALPLGDGVLLGLAKFNGIREIDFDNRVAVVEPGVTNLAVTEAVEHAGFYYAPDPSSQIACTLGGNVAENSGGVHCLKYGMTSNNVIGCEIVLMNGDVVRLGGKHLDCGGFDHLAMQVEAIARDCGAVSCRASGSEEERLLFWAGRKAAFPAVGRISPDYYCMDGTIPRGKLPFVLGRMRELSKRYGLRVANVFHAADGNLHPLILYDANAPGELECAEAFESAIWNLCV